MKKSTGDKHFEECLVKGFVIVHTSLVQWGLAEKLHKSSYSVEVGTTLNGHRVFAHVGKNTLVFFYLTERKLSSGRSIHGHSPVSHLQVAQAYLAQHGHQKWIAMCGELWDSFCHASQMN